jgi:hypothetical protein
VCRFREESGRGFELVRANRGKIGRGARRWFKWRGYAARGESEQHDMSDIIIIVSHMHHIYECLFESSCHVCIISMSVYLKINFIHYPPMFHVFVRITYVVHLLCLMCKQKIVF